VCNELPATVKGVDAQKPDTVPDLMMLARAGLCLLVKAWYHRPGGLSNMNGTITINGVYDPQLETILRVKERHEASVRFNPQQMQPMQQPIVRPGYPPQPTPPGNIGEGYNNVVINWDGEDGLAGIT